MIVIQYCPNSSRRSCYYTFLDEPTLCCSLRTRPKRCGPPRRRGAPPPPPWAGAPVARWGGEASARGDGGVTEGSQRTRRTPPDALGSVTCAEASATHSSRARSRGVRPTYIPRAGSARVIPVCQARPRQTPGLRWPTEKSWLKRADRACGLSLLRPTEFVSVCRS